MNEFPYLTDANAFFRRAHTPLREKYLNAKTEMSPDVSRYEGEFDFEPDDLSKLDVKKLVAECEIDHTVPPVEYFTGSREAALKQLKWACETCCRFTKKCARIRRIRCRERAFRRFCISAF